MCCEPHAYTQGHTVDKDIIKSCRSSVYVPVKVVLVIGGGLHMGDLLSWGKQRATQNSRLLTLKITVSKET